MQSLTIRRIQTGFAAMGVIIVILGMSLNFGIPSETNPSLTTLLEEETTASNIRFNQDAVTNQFQLDLRIQNSSVYDCSTSLLNTTKFDNIQIVTSQENLEITFKGTNTSSYLLEIELDEDLEEFLVCINNYSCQVQWIYFYSIIPSTYFPSLIVAFSGLLLALLTLILQCSGIKRYFFIGLFINTSIFSLRIFALANMELGMPYGVDYVLELYNEYSAFFITWINELWKRAGSYSAYFSGYIYFPLFTYTISALGSLATWLPSIIQFSFNISTSYLVYQIVQYLKRDKKWSILAMMTYILNPLALFYSSFLWLNPAPYVFLAALSFYLVSRITTTKTASITNAATSNCRNLYVNDSY